MVYFIIFGTRGITSSFARGDFYCPDCSSQRPYNHKRVRRFFTLYFIPLIPLDLLGEYVECEGCSSTYKPTVLQLDPVKAQASGQAEFLGAMRRVMVLMMLADGVVDESEIEMICDVFGKMAKRSVSRAEIEHEIQVAKSEGKAVEEFCRTIAAVLNESGKEMVVRAAFMVAAADGKFEPAEKELLTRIGKALELSPAHYRGLMAELEEKLAAA